MLGWLEEERPFRFIVSRHGTQFNEPRILCTNHIDLVKRKPVWNWKKMLQNLWPKCLGDERRVSRHGEHVWALREALYFNICNMFKSRTSFPVNYKKNCMYFLNRWNQKLYSTKLQRSGPDLSAESDQSNELRGMRVSGLSHHFVPLTWIMYSPLSNFNAEGGH